MPVSGFWILIAVAPLVFAAARRRAAGSVRAAGGLERRA
jgi:hypothetical protein